MAGEGGAVCISVAGTSATLRNVTITGNNARNGGAIAVANGTFKIGNSVMSGNTAVELSRSPPPDQRHHHQRRQ